MNQIRFLMRLDELHDYLLKSRFKQSIIREQFHKAKQVDRDTILCQDMENKNKDNRVSLVIDYHPAFTGLDRMICSLGGILHESDDMKRIFEKPPRV